MHITLTLWPIAPWVWHVAIGFGLGVATGGGIAIVFLSRLMPPPSGMF